MGLLDEAIRDHLELKRRRGADPTVIAREEHEALEPVFPQEPSGEPVAEELPAQATIEPQELVSAQEVATESAPIHEADSSPGFSAVGQETAELDMQAFLDADAQMAEAGEAPEQIPGQERLSFE